MLFIKLHTDNGTYDCSSDLYSLPEKDELDEYEVTETRERLSPTSEKVEKKTPGKGKAFLSRLMVWFSDNYYLFIRLLNSTFFQI